MKYELVVFDMDGTILNTLDDLADSVNFILAKHGFALHTNEEIKYMVGNGIPKLVERALPRDISKAEFDSILSEFLQYYSTHCDIKTAPYVGIVDCIKKIKASGIKVAVNTNKQQEAAEKLCEKMFPDLFDVIAGQKDGIPVKPAPDGIYNIVKELFGIEDCGNAIQNQQKIKACYIGDSDVDIQTGKNCGFDFIGVDWGFRGEKFLRENGTKIVVKNTEELLQSLI